MASIGDALIYGIPFLLLVFLTFGLANELYFIGMAGFHEDGYDRWDDFNGKCFTQTNSWNTFCKSDFGFLGMKQWIDERDYVIIRELVS